MRHTAFLVCAAALAGCAIGPGEPMGTLSASVIARFQTPAARATEDGFQKLASDYQVRIDRFELVVPELVLLGAADVSTIGFDPAKPPPGYSLCHGGHCHRDDGALIPYEEIALAGAASGPAPVVSLPAGEIDFVNGTELRNLACAPDCELEETSLRSLQLPISRLAIEGEVRDSRGAARIAPRRFTALLPLEGADPIDSIGGSLAGDEVTVIEARVELPIDRENAPRIRLTIRLEPTAQLFDRIDWATAKTTADGVIALESSANLTQRLQLFGGLAELPVTFDVERGVR